MVISAYRKIWTTAVAVDNYVIHACMLARIANRADCMREAAAYRGNRESQSP